MNLDVAPRDLDEMREMKVKIPLRMHISLHSLKILSGRQLSEIVTEALMAYLAQQAHARGSAPPMLAGYDDSRAGGVDPPPAETAGY